ncbi:MAG: hypothetical protein MUF40_03200 [Gemmatimonadaceae bacterium]|jgi:ABC-type uncharacterized transport system YnjBCD permease subunit|nr:hypothetical protein [Gemmatimonadaceae bacterium]
MPMPALHGALPFAIAGLLVVPALLGIGYALLASVGLAGAGASGATVAAWAATLRDREVAVSLAWTLATSAVATVLALEGAVRAASRVHPDGAVARVLALPLAVPHAGAALAMLWLLAPAGLVARLLHAIGMIDAPAAMPRLVHDPLGIALVLTAIWKELPFLFVVALGARRRDAVRLLEAARTVGASPVSARRLVLEPHLRRATLPAAVAAFAFVLGAWELPALLAPTAPPALALLVHERWTDVLLATRAQAHVLALVALVPAALAAWAGARAWRRASVA